MSEEKVFLLLYFLSMKSSFTSKENEDMPCNDGMFLNFTAIANMRNAVMEKASNYKFFTKYYNS
jgi:hypothetical protein